MGLNATGTGRLTRDPELKKSKAGVAYCQFSIASDRVKKKDGQPEADFFECTAFGKTAELIAKTMVKGSKIVITEASLQNDSWEAGDGSKRTKTRIIISGFEFGESKAEAEARRAKANKSSNSDSTEKADSTKTKTPVVAPADKMLVPEDDDDEDEDFELPYT